jgi:hypothetical protein
LLHLPSSIEVPFGIIANTALLVAGDVLRLLSRVRVIGLAIAQVAGTSAKTAAHAAIRTGLMVVLFSFHRVAASAVGQCREQSRIQEFASKP